MRIKKLIFSLVAMSITLGVSTRASVTVSVNFTQAEDARETLHDMWTVANRISPDNGVAVRPGMKVNTVRMIGGIVDKDANGVRTPNLDFDTCTYDEVNQEYVYHFDRLTDRIDKIRNGGTPIYQIVLDQPPWAFQRGYTFIPEGEMDGVHFRENERISIYGNSLPPYDKSAYAAYIKAMIEHLIAEYGEALVKSWRFRVGSEIETPDHWHGTEQDFIEHFANTVTAIRSALPDAIIGLHTRPPGFVYTKNNLVNYKGEVIKSFANGLIEYCYDNNIRYDFWGISDYPIIKTEKYRHPKKKFDEMFEGLVSHPKWQTGTVIDVEEFSVITKISPLVSSDSAQAHTFLVAMTDLFYSKGVDQVFQWGQRIASHEHWRTKVFTEMVGKIRYQADISSTFAGDEENIGAIIAASADDNSIDVILHNYDPADLEAEDTKNISVALTTSYPEGTSFYYRKTLAGKEQNAFNTFMDGQPGSSWLNNGFSRYGNSTYSLNETGKAAWAAYENPTPREWTEWQTATTLPAENGESGSIINIETQLPLFSFEKIEVRWDRGPGDPTYESGNLLIGWDQWTETPTSATVENGLSGSTANVDSTWAQQFRGGSADGTFGSLSVDIAAADTTIGSTSDFHYTGYRSAATGERSIDFTVSAETGTDFDLDHFRFDIVTRGGNGNGTWTLEILESGSLTAGIIESSTIEANYTANYLSNVDVPLGALADPRIDAGESATFRLTISTPDNRSVDLDNVGITGEGTTVVNLDTDDNGLPDAWEIEYFGAKGQIPTLDGDGDGYSNIQEYIIGTNPKQNSSTLKVAVQPNSNSDTISWNSATGRLYNVYSSTDLASTGWTLVAEDLAGTGETLSYEATREQTAALFYKIEVSYP